MFSRIIKKLFAVLVITMMILGAAPISASSATADQIASQINAISGLSATVDGSIVTVTGSATASATRTLALNVAAGVTVEWNAIYRGTANPVIDIKGGTLSVNSDALIKNVSSQNSFSAIRATDAAVVVNGGAIQAGLGSAIEGAGTTTVTVNSGQVFNNATHNLRPVINMTNDSYTGLNITINGGEVFADLTGTTATTPYGYVLQTYGNIEINDGTVSTNGTNGRGINLVGRTSVATVTGGTVLATGGNGVAISTATTPGVDVTETQVNVTGGFVASYGTGNSLAIRTTGSQSTVSVSGGAVFSYGNRITGPSNSVIYTQNNPDGFTGATDDGGVIAWDRQAWNDLVAHNQGTYFVDAYNHIVVSSSEGTASWENHHHDPDGIRFTFGSNSGFVNLPEVTVVGPDHKIITETVGEGTIESSHPGESTLTILYGDPPPPPFRIVPADGYSILKVVLLNPDGSEVDDPQLIYAIGEDTVSGDAFEYQFERVTQDRIIRAYFTPILPVDPTPVDPTPVDPTPVDPTPVDPAPVDPAPVDPAPVDPAPVDPTPVDPTPVDPTPADPTPVDPTPADPTPADPTPVDPPVPPSAPGTPGTPGIPITPSPAQPHKIIAFAGEGGTTGAEHTVAYKTVTVADDDSISIVFTADPGFRIKEITIDGDGEQPSSPQEHTHSFLNVHGDHVITATFEPIPRTITPTTDGGGSITPSDPVTVPHGSDQTFIIVPDPGYFIDVKLVNGDPIVPARRVLEIPDVTADHDIHIVFSSVEYHNHIITATADNGGTISPSGDVPVPDGGYKTFTITPNPGFRVSAVLVDGVNVGAVTEYTFLEVRDNHTIHVEFEPLESAPQTSDNRSLTLPIAMLALGVLIIAGAELYRRRLKDKR